MSEEKVEEDNNTTPGDNSGQKKAGDEADGSVIYEHEKANLSVIDYEKQQMTLLFEDFKKRQAEEHKST